MQTKIEKTFRASIYLAGDVAVILQACREHCYAVGLCVTVTSCAFVYTGGEESGSCVGLVNYPRFPSLPSDLTARALALAEVLMVRACQHTALVVTDTETYWLSRRNENPAAK